ncbi:biotin-dependent carboxyltransferase family protein [Sediminicola sp. 1XM1-17]|uniref:5-oxoprolinase subunit C family protein n=1 Tax=Sediminicola sp. 1XM1-17 TaxID=3127702 RepID=UPI0030786D4B
MLNVIKSGFFTTVQDLGRFNYRNKGVPVSGVMDSFSYAILNMLLENDKKSAVLEITMTGPRLEFEADTYIVAGGAELPMSLNDQPIKNFKIHKVLAGDIVSFGKLEHGLRSYLAIKGGFKSPLVLGSRSYYKPLTSSSRIKDNDQIPYDECKDFEPKIQEIKAHSLLRESVLEVFEGPEYRLLTEKQTHGLFGNDFTIAKENNRMAYQLNEAIEGHAISMLTSATLPGTIQLTPSGKLIILMKDGQTTGGYPRILQLSEKAISILAQKRYGDDVSFTLL